MGDGRVHVDAERPERSALWVSIEGFLPLPVEELAQTKAMQLTLPTGERAVTILTKHGDRTKKKHAPLPLTSVWAAGGTVEIWRGEKLDLKSL